MEDRYESAVLAAYVLNILRAHKPNRNSAEKIWNCLHEEVANLGLIRAAGLRPFFKGVDEASLDSSRIAKLFADHREPLLRGLEKSAVKLKKSRPGRLEKSIRALSGELGLDYIDKSIFALFLRYKTNPAVERLGDNLVEVFGHRGLVATMLGIRTADVFTRLRPGYSLKDLGLIQAWRGYRSSGFDDLGEVPDMLVSVLQESKGTIADINRLILGEPAKPELEWDDYLHMGEARDRLETFLRHCLRSETPGVNVLLYGPPGTGKTEFTKTLGKRLGARVYNIGEDINGAEPERDNRLSALKTAQALLQKQSDVLLVFDEMEDVFDPQAFTMGRGQIKQASKVYTNRLLENNAVPTIWIINDPCAITQMHIRRMSLALELRTPPAAARKKVLSRILDRHGCSLPEDEISEICRQEAVAPAVLDNAVRYASSTGGKAEDVRFAVKSIVKAMTGGIEKPRVEKAETEFNLALANTDTDLAVLADNVSKPGSSRAFSLCLFGPPGTGKTEYVRHLAFRMGMEVLVRRASDIFGPFVGQTEANIARAFAEAREGEMFLVFDEADSFLGDRREAQRSWEITQVNEMLTWMESHPLPFACTTNLMDHLDEASLRRFTFKVKFDFMERDQQPVAWKYFFNQGPPDALDSLANLTPGDFVVVKNRAGLLGCLDAPSEILSMLEGEARLKKTGITVTGFGS